MKDSVLAGAGSRITHFAGSLILIDTDTGETVSIASDALFSYDIAYDPLKDRLYSLSAEKDGDDTVTTVTMHYGENYETHRLLLKHPGEDLSATLNVSPDDREVYTSLGYEGISAWDGSTLKRSETPRFIPRKISVTKDYVFTLNRNSSITMWDRKGNKVYCEFFLFDDLSWAIYFPHERAYISHNADEHIIIPK